MSALSKQTGGLQVGVAKDWAVKLPCRPQQLQRVFEEDLSKDKTPLPKWFAAIALLLNAKKSRSNFLSL
ncbi:MAG: hypothetical protein M2R45_00562 [Verrucomicrobia subdivision 3 bacterium]|nr:hypothetical protein [Limisphaerales bacterium]MCS1407404.1 hypothetical protein [Limisphaerales bacterium]MCS1413560.1 hypothetical protein [Limisphaerales bacterium]MCS1413584.1 hypothetical protein [Limisphaerales bacterium]